MAEILVIYGTTEGQTRKIAERIAQQIVQRGHAADLRDSTALPDDLDPGTYAAIIVAASLHAGHHQTAVAHFVRHHRPALEARPSAFISVSLSAAGDAHDRHEAQECADRFLHETGWRPVRTHLVAGAFRYTQYDFFKRWMMKRIARDKGAPTDTSRDWELTDWDDLARLVDDFLIRAGLGSP